MKKSLRISTGVFMILIGLGLWTLPLKMASAHCDTMAGPVIQDARTALEKGDITPVLKWIKKDQEKTVKEAFRRARAVKNPALKEKAERQFFETLVRIHRAGEGAPFTGLKPEEAVEPIIAAADQSLESGSVEVLIKQVTDEVAAGIRKRFEKVVNKKNHVDENVKAGREYVAAYVDYTHYVEGLYQKALEEDTHHHGKMKKQRHHKTEEVKKEDHHSSH